MRIASGVDRTVPQRTRRVIPSRAAKPSLVSMLKCCRTHQSRRQRHRYTTVHTIPRRLQTAHSLLAFNHLHCANSILRLSRSVVQADFSAVRIQPERTADDFVSQGREFNFSSFANSFLTAPQWSGAWNHRTDIALACRLKSSSFTATI